MTNSPSGGINVTATDSNFQIGGDVVGRDKIVNNIQNLIERAQTAAEELAGERALEFQTLARGIAESAARLHSIAEQTDDTASGNPYRGLAAYRLDDAELYFGRNAALAGVIRHLQRGPVSVLHSEPGLGRTSLLQAGLSARIIAAGHFPIYLRVQNTNPSLLIKRALLPDPSAAPFLATATLYELLQAAAQLIGGGVTLYILVDEAERLFTHLDDSREEFIVDLAECLADPSLNVRWLFALPTEHTGRLIEFHPRVANPLENETQLLGLHRAEAAEIVVASAQRGGVSVEDSLLTALLDELGSDDIPPAQLQIVCSALYDAKPPEAQTLTLALYESLGRAARLLDAHTAQALARDFAPAQRAAAQRLLLGRGGSQTRPYGQGESETRPYEIDATADPAILRQLVASRLARCLYETDATGESTARYVLARTHRANLPPLVAVAPSALNLPPAAPLAIPASPPPGVVRPAIGVPPPPLVPAPARAESDEGGGGITISAVQSNLTISGDLVGRDKIINNIQNIYQRALSAAEEAATDRSLETQALAQGVGALAQRLHAIASDTSDTRGGSPYKGLLAYRLSDSEIFFGRSQAIAAVLSRLQRGVFTVLHSESGAGKSSLIQAGLAPRLIGAGHLPLYLRPYNANPVQIIKRAFIADPSIAPVLATAPLREFLRQTSEILGPQTVLYIILDQAEELFTQLDDDGRAEFITELAECVDDPSLNVRWVLSLRTEFFGNLANFRPQIANPFENDFRLNRLNHTEAAEVVIEPARQSELIFEDGLVDELLGDLGRDNLPPPQLQLVCSGLYDGLPPGATTFTRAQYAAAGGANGILRDHLARVMGRNLKPAQRPIAQRVFESLITADGRRAVHTLAELRADLNANQLHGLAAETLAEVLNQLVDSRLLRAQEKDETAEAGLAYELASGLSAEMTQALAYELAHDYLLDQIRLDPDVQARKAAQELLEQEVRTYQRYKTLLTPERLAVIAPHRATLRLTPEAEQLLTASEAEVEREQRAEEARRQKELEDIRKLAESERQRAEEQTAARRRAQRLTTVIAGVAGGAVLAAIAAIFFGFQSNQNALRAAREARLARGRELAAEAVNAVSHDPELSLMFGLQSLRATAPDGFTLPAAEDVMHRALSEARLLRTLSANAAGLTQAVFSPDGKWIATASDDDTAKIWNAQTGELALTLAGHTADVYAVAFSPDGKWLATGSADYTAKIWEAATAQELRTLSGHEYFIYALAFSPDGKFLATASGDTTAKVWDVETGADLTTLAGPEVQLLGLAFSPDGQRLAASGENGVALVWELKTGAEVLSLHGHEKTVYQIVFSPDGTRLATAGFDGTAKLWEATTGANLPLAITHLASVVGVAFSADGAYLVTASSDATAKVWDAVTSQLRFTLAGHVKEVTSVNFSPDGLRLVTSSRDGTAKVWDISPASGQELVTAAAHAGKIYTVVYSHAGDRFATASNDGTAKIWDATTGDVLLTLAPTGAAPEVYDLVFTPDDKRLVTSGCDAFDEDGNCLAGTVSVWDALAGQAVLTFTPHLNGVQGLALSPDGTKLATASWDYTAKILELATGREVMSHTAHSLLNRIAFGPNNTQLAFTTYDPSDNVFLWGLASGQVLTLSGHVDWGGDVVFSPNGQRLASTSQDGSTLLWDTATGRSVLSLGGHNGGVQGVAFSPDGTRLATAGVDKMVMVWDANTGERLLTLSGHTDEVWGVAFSPDGRQLASVGADASVRRYLLPLADLQTLALSRLTRWFSAEECARFFVSEACPAR